MPVYAFAKTVGLSAYSFLPLLKEFKQYYYALLNKPLMLTPTAKRLPLQSLTRVMGIFSGFTVFGYNIFSLLHFIDYSENENIKCGSA